MSVYELKPRFQALLRPAVRWLAARGVTANQLTIGAALGSLALGAVLAVDGADAPWLFLLLPPWLLARMALNAMDGMLAREHGQRSALGAVLNELSDPVADTALVAPFAWIAPFSPVLVAAVAVLGVLTELAGVVAVTIGASRRYDGPMGKSDRALVLAILGAAVATFRPLPSPVGWTMPALVVLLLLTVLRRVRNGLAEARPAVGRLTVRPGDP